MSLWGLSRMFMGLHKGFYTVSQGVHTWRCKYPSDSSGSYRIVSLQPSDYASTAFTLGCPLSSWIIVGNG